MKRIKIGIIALIILGTYSCKKTWTCECTTTTDTNGVVEESVVVSDVDKQKLSDAQEECESSNGTIVNDSVTTTVNCIFERS